MARSVDPQAVQLMEELMAEPDFDFGAELLKGAKQIGEYHNLTPRQTYWKIQQGEIPTFRWGGMVCTFKSLMPRVIAVRLRKAVGLLGE